MAKLVKETKQGDKIYFLSNEEMIGRGMTGDERSIALQAQVDKLSSLPKSSAKIPYTLSLDKARAVLASVIVHAKDVNGDSLTCGHCQKGFQGWKGYLGWHLALNLDTLEKLQAKATIEAQKHGYKGKAKLVADLSAAIKWATTATFVNPLPSNPCVGIKEIANDGR